jgi:hypothetical protein
MARRRSASEDHTEALKKALAVSRDNGKRVHPLSPDAPQHVRAAWEEVNRQWESVEKGQRRNTWRAGGRKPSNSNDPRMDALAYYDPYLIDGFCEITTERLEGALTFLKERGLATDGLDVATLRKAIYRARGSSK